MRYNGNGLGRTALFLFLSTLVVVALRFAPPLGVGDYEVRPVDFLADVWPEDFLNLWPEDTAGAEHDSVPAPAVRPEWSDSCPPGMVCIEDYAVDYRANMGRFYEALSSRDSLGRPVRIAYFGDSYIEGDIMTCDLREMLQEHYGGCGVGFVDIATPLVALRPTLRHSYGGWVSHCVLDTTPYTRSRIGISGRYAVSGGAYVTIGGSDRYAHLDTFEVATLFLSASDAAVVGITADGGERNVAGVLGRDTVAAVNRIGRMGRVRFDVPAGVVCYGMAAEGRSGITVDNLSLRGGSGLNLMAPTERHLEQFAAVRPYDLIVLQYGLNVALPQKTNYESYVRQMTTVIDKLKKTNPQAAILIVGVGDRENKIRGKLQTLPGVKALIGYQNNMAADNHVAFWNLYNAMGGEGSIVAMAGAKPAEAARDYIHINYHGGRRIATLLFDAIVFGHKEYERRKAYDD